FVKQAALVIQVEVSGQVESVAANQHQIAAALAQAHEGQAARVAADQLGDIAQCHLGNVDALQVQATAASQGDGAAQVILFAHHHVVHLLAAAAVFGEGEDGEHGALDGE